MGVCDARNDAQFEHAPRCARDSEMEPLEKRRMRIAADGEVGAGARNGHNFDIAAVECGVDHDRGVTHANAIDAAISAAKPYTGLR